MIFSSRPAGPVVAFVASNGSVRERVSSSCAGCHWLFGFTGELIGAAVGDAALLAGGKVENIYVWGAGFFGWGSVLDLVGRAGNSYW